VLCVINQFIQPPSMACVSAGCSPLFLSCSVFVCLVDFIMQMQSEQRHRSPGLLGNRTDQQKNKAAGIDRTK
jgi:hypothetical protein